MYYVICIQERGTCLLTPNDPRSIDQTNRPTEVYRDNSFIILFDKISRFKISNFKLFMAYGTHCNHDLQNNFSLDQHFTGHKKFVDK